MNNYFTLCSAYNYNYVKSYEDDIVEKFNVSYAVRPSMITPSKCCTYTGEKDMNTVESPSPLGTPDEKVPLEEPF
tara:strand:- start:413 stop:637 length:225 start_codon:yes stop_codon:yes gene_type:complete